VVRVSACTGNNRSVPDLIGRTKSQAQSAWTAAGFTGTLTTWNGGNNDTVDTQNRPAYSCVPQSSTMVVTR
jgi:beta-lactam-binding protein with PASTA domain